MSRAWDAMVTVGRIVRPHGLRGDLVVLPETDFPDERFRPGAEVYLAPAGEEPPRPCRVRGVRWHGGRLLVAFEGIESLEDAETLVRGELRVSADELVALPDGHFYLHDLVGCEVVTTRGEPVGAVKRVEGGGPRSLLVVEGRRGEILIPLVVDICRQVDVEARRIVIEPPNGLLDLNA